MSIFYGTGTHRLIYKAQNFTTGLTVTAYIWNPSLTKSALQTFTEVSDGIYYLDYNFAVAGTHFGKFYEGGTGMIAGTFRVEADIAALHNLSSSDVITACASALGTYDAPTKAELDAGLAALNDITVAQIIAGIADGSYDLQEMMRIMFAALAGESNGGGTTSHKYRDSADSKNRITATVDANGNRTAVTLDGS